MLAVAETQRLRRRRREARRKSKKRQRIIERDVVCVYCGVVPDGSTPDLAATLDHVVPKSQGGRSSEDNLVLACFRCNNRKANLGPEEFRAGSELPTSRRPGT